MKPSGFDIIELSKKQSYKSIQRFFTRFHLSSALKAANAYKRKGTSATLIFQYLFLLVFSNRSMYMSLMTGKDTPDFEKDMVKREYGIFEDMVVGKGL